MRKAEIKKVAFLMARRRNAARLPNGEFPSFEFGRVSGIEAGKKIRTATSRKRITALLEKEDA